MCYILFSTAGFLCILISDILQIYKKRILIIPFSIIGYLGVLSVIIFLTLEQQVYPASSLLVAFKICLAVLSFAGLVFVLFIEIPFSSQYMGSHCREAYSGGTYGIVRHPGFIMILLLIGALNWIFLNREYLIITIVIIFLDLLLILIEDYVVFPKIFSNYKIYKKKVPFLIPGMKS